MSYFQTMQIESNPKKDTEDSFIYLKGEDDIKDNEITQPTDFLSYEQMEQINNYDAVRNCYYLT